jgi:transposase
MKFVNKLTPEEIITLKELNHNCTIHRLRIRALILLMSDRGLKINQISLAIDIVRDTVSTVIFAWDTIGIRGLYDDIRTGRPPIFNQKDKEVITDQIKKEPRNLKTVAAEVEKLTGKKSSVDTIKRIAKKNGLIWKRIKKKVAGKPDPIEYEQKKQEIIKLKNKANEGEINLHYVDESGFSLVPVVPYAWQPIGDNIFVPSARSQRVNVLGFLRSDNQLESITFNCPVDTDAVIAAIDTLFPAVEKDTWFVMDNAPIHKSNKFKEKIEEWSKKKIFVIFLPPYSPELNPIEILWRFIKYQWLTFSAYECFKNLTAELNAILAGYGQKYQITFA